MKKLITKLTTLLIAITMSTSLMAQMTLVFTTTEDDQSITLPLYGTVNVTVDWGDLGSTNAYTTTGDKDHTYATAGTYIVSISGSLTQFGNGGNSYTNAEKLIEVTSFGSIGITSLKGAFYGTTNLAEVPTSLPATITDLTFTFRNTGKESITGLNNWDVSNVTLMYGVFYEATAFNQYIGGWNVSNVTIMESMFYNAAAFNQNIGGWNVSSVTNMRSMFYGTDVFDGNIGGWERTGSSLANVTNMSYMFKEASSFNQEIGNWNVGNVTDMNSMFYNAVAFNKALDNWVVSKVDDMESMFRYALVFNKPLNSWTVSNVEKMGYMFYEARQFNQPLNNWDVSKVTYFSGLDGMFQNANAFNQSLNDWDVSNIKRMRYMFYGADVFNGDISDWVVSAVTDMSNMFYSASNFNQDISGWDVSAVTSMSYMFHNADAFNQDINDWTVNSVENMNNMFDRANIFNQDIGSWDVSSVTNMSNMFVYTTNFDQDLGSWDVSNVTTMVSMFDGVTLSTPNYNSLLIGWDALELYDGVTFSGGSSKYSPGAAATAKANIISADSWTITDGGEETSITWDGTTDSDWNTGTNWSGDAVPITTSNVVIPVVGTTYPEIATDGTASCNNLTIYSGATLTINSTSSVSTGSLIVNGSSMGNVTVKRFLTHDRWHYIAGQTDISGNFSTLNMDLVSGDNDQFYRWDESLVDGTTGFWVDILNGPAGNNSTMGSESFVSSKGYAINYAGEDKTLSLSGVPYTISKNINITKTDGSTNPGSNLVGNPFTSSIAANSLTGNANNFLTTNSGLLDETENAIYLWNEQPGYQGIGTRNDYLPISNLSSATYLAPGQAFMVVKRAEGTTSLPFNTNMREHGSATFYKNTTQDDVSRFYMSVENEAGLYNEILIGFLDGMTNGLDVSYDAGKLKGNPDIALYTKLVDDIGTDFAHQALPLLDNNNVAVKIGLDVSTAGNYTFKIKELQNFDETIPIKLEDKLTGSIIDLRQAGEYSFFVNSPGEIRERFVLHFNGVTGIEDEIQITKASIQTYASNNTLYILNPKQKQGTVTIYNLTGQKVTTFKLTGDTKQQQTLNIADIINIVKIQTNDDVISEKVIFR